MTFTPDIELAADRHEEQQQELHLIRYEEEVQAYMEMTGCDRIVAEIRVEQSIGANPDSYYPEVY